MSYAQQIEAEMHRQGTDWRCHDGIRHLAAQADAEIAAKDARIAVLEAFVRHVQCITDNGTVYGMACDLLEKKP